MKNSNKLFVICTIYVPIMMILLFYPQINDFYTYSVPLKNIVISKSTDISVTFQEVINKDSECFTTPNRNLFCYLTPTMRDPVHGASFVKGENGIEGEIHFDSVDDGTLYFTMKNMGVIKGDTVLITFADNDYRYGSSDSTRYEIQDEFEFSSVIEKFDTFISHCGNYEGTSVTIVQYLGIKTIDDQDYFLTWHTSGDSEQGVECDYPQLIQHSLDYNFREL